MKKKMTYAGIVLSAATLSALCVVSPVSGSLDPGNGASAEVKPPRQSQPSRSGGGNRGAQPPPQQRESQPRASQPQRPSQDRAAQERASQQRAAQERASQERASQERAAQQREAQDREVLERASEQREAQERASSQRESQDRAAEDAARRRAESDMRERMEQSRERSGDDARRAEQDRISHDRISQDRISQEREDSRAQQERAEELRRQLGSSEREQTSQESGRNLFDERAREDNRGNLDDRARDLQTERSQQQPPRTPERSAALDDMRRRLEEVRRDEAARPGDRGRDAADDRAAGLLEGPDIRRDRDGERDNSGEFGSNDRAGAGPDRDRAPDAGMNRSDDADAPRLREMPVLPGTQRNDAKSDNDRIRTDLDRSRSGGPSIELPRSSGSRNEIDGRDPRVFSQLDRDERSKELTRQSNHLDRNSLSGRASTLPLHRDVDRHVDVNRHVDVRKHVDVDIHRHVNKSVHFHDHHKRVVVNHWAHHPRFHGGYRSHCDDDFAWLSFSTGSFGFGFSFGHSHWRPYRHCSPWWNYRAVHRPYHFAPVRYHYYSYAYDNYCDWYYGSWYRPYVKVVHHYDYSPAWQSYDDDSSYSSSSVLTSGGYDDDYSGTSIFGDEVVAQPATMDEAWQLLVDGFLTEAREMFVEIGSQYPFEGEPQLGYALAAGLLHDDEAAAFALRKAMTDQPESIVLVPQNLAMQGHLSRLLERWEAISREQSSPDAMFMIASIRFMLQDGGDAYFAVDQAISAGDDDPSTLNLKDVIRASMYDTMYDE